jgi:hypothetical protein
MIGLSVEDLACIAALSCHVGCIAKTRSWTALVTQRTAVTSQGPWSKAESRITFVKTLRIFGHHVSPILADSYLELDLNFELALRRCSFACLERTQILEPLKTSGLVSAHGCSLEVLQRTRLAAAKNLGHNSSLSG